MVDRIVCPHASNNFQAHSFPPSSLDYRSTELIVSPKKVVGCKGGSRYVEGFWGLPYLKIEKLANFHFMLCDRYEIHIQDVEDFFTEIFIISPSLLTLDLLMP